MTTASTVPNPFIGPRSFETGEKLFGRERELRALVHLLTAERVVLLYSPSGAGKSSLIKAALTPALEKRDFAPLPHIRVNQELPRGTPPGANRYVYSTLLSLEERRAPEERLPPADLAGLSLPDYLQQRALPPVRATGRDPVLIFDQFEEVLTADPTNLAAKHAFFGQLGRALADRHLWALFAMREDYLAALDPYLEAIPNRFKDTFRLDLLGADAARQAMQGPAKAAGVIFTTKAAARLADDLRRTRVQRPDGTSEEVLGPYVEPVQLQVVCLRLWEQRFAPEAPRRMPVITPDDISDVGDVDSALAGYYADRVRAVSTATGVKERAIRDWFDSELITPEGQRSQVMREPEESAGLDNRAIMALIDAHLVRGDERHGTLWYELTHDRLVAPIRQNNSAWRLQTLTAFQRQAILWDEQGRGDGLLLRGEALAEGERWAEAHAAALTEGERDFLDACRKARALRQQQERYNRRIFQTLVGTVVAAVIALGLAILTYREQQESNRQRQAAEDARQSAEQQARTSLFRAISALSLDSRAQFPQRSLLLAVTTQQITVSQDLQLSVGLNTLIQGLQRINGLPLRGHTGAVRGLAFSPNGKLLATASDDGTVRLWHADAPNTPPIILRGHTAAINALAFSPDNRTLATASDDGTARLWHTDTPSTPSSILGDHGRKVIALALSQDGRLLATGNVSGTVRLWRLDAPDTSAIVLSGHTDAINALAFSPDSHTLATGSKDKQVRLWSVDAPAPTPTVLDQHKEPIRTLAFSPDGRTLATASSDKTVRLWHLDALAKPPDVLQGHEDAVSTLAFSPDGRTLATGGYDNTVRLWSLDTPAAPKVKVLRGHDNWIASVAFSPDGRTLASSSFDKTIRLWNLDDSSLLPRVLYGHEGSIRTLAFSPDGRTLASSGYDNTARLWRLDTPGLLLGHTDRITAMALQPHGQTLATGSLDGTIRLWHLNSPSVPLTTTLDQYKEPIKTLAFSPDGQTLATGSVSGTVRLWRMTAPGYPSTVLSEDGESVTKLAFSPDGRFLATGYVSGTVRLWRADAPSTPPTVLAELKKEITALVFSPDSQTLATGNNGKTVHLLHLGAGAAPPTILRGHKDAILSLAFSPDGQTLATGSRDSTARLWDLKSAVIRSSILSGHDYGISTLAFSPDSQTLATGSQEGVIRLWQVRAPDLPAIVLSGHTDTVTALAFSPDGRLLASGSWDKTGRLWQLDRGELVWAACEAAGRNLSLDEWRQLHNNRTTVPYAETCLHLPRHPSVYQELLAHSQFGLALMGNQEDRSIDSAAEAPAAWLANQAAGVSEDAPLQAVLIYTLARWRDPQLRGAHPADLATLCQAGANSVPTPALLDACDRVLADDPASPDLLSARGKLRARLGDTAGALADLQAALRLAQEQLDTLGDIQRWIGDLQAGRDPLASPPASH